MSQPVDGSSDEDGSSLRSNGSNVGVKEAVGLIRSSLRRSFRLVAKKIPPSPGKKGSKVTPKEDESGPEPPPPPSPSPSSGSSLTSPLKNVGGFFSQKEEDDCEMTPKRRKGLTRSKTDPNMMRFGDSFKKKVASGRRSLRFSSRKEKSSEEALVPVFEGAAEGKMEEEEEEVEEEYDLPALPDVPLSVMQISKLIEMKELEEAHLHLLALRQEFQREQRSCEEESLLELGKKEKDLSLLYGDLRSKIQAVVRESNSPASLDKDLLLQAARIIQEEERRAEEPGGLAGSWMGSWREAVAEGVQAKVGSVPLESKEQNVSWLAVHLALLGKAIVEDLEGVRKELRRSYPPSFKVFGAYVSSYHRVAGRHLKELDQQTTELKDMYALLDWTINGYKSERIMASVSLQPHMNEESKELQLEDGLLEQLKDKYCCRVKEELSSALDKILELQDEEMWRERKTPEKEEGLLCSHISMDIRMIVEGNIQASGRIDAQLKVKVISACMNELTRFPRSFQAALRRRCGALRPQRLWTDYHITYINSFADLQRHMDSHRDACPDQVDSFKKEAEWLMRELMTELEEQFKVDVQPYLRRMMTRKWMTNDEDFRQLRSRTDSLAQHCSLMRPEPAKELASRLHYHVVREYVGQLMKGNYSCKNRKHEKAAAKIKQQLEELRELFERSTHEWLRHVGKDLSELIGPTNKRDIKDKVEPMAEHYPDFSRNHLVALLRFRGLPRGREHQRILRKLADVKKTLDNSGDNSQTLFSDIPVTVNTDCLSNLPFSCFSP